MLENRYYKDAENTQIILELGCRNEILLLSIALHCVCLKKRGCLFFVWTTISSQSSGSAEGSVNRL